MPCRRWYSKGRPCARWWMAAMVCAFVVSTALYFAGYDNNQPRDFAWIMIITVSVTTVVWLAATFLTAPESKDTLVAFYRRTRPSVVGWGPVTRLAPDVKASGDGWRNLLDTVCGIALIYGWLFGIGKLLLGETALGLALIAGGMAAGAVIYRDLSSRGWSTVVD